MADRITVVQAGDICLHVPGHIGLDDWVVRRQDPNEDVPAADLLEAVRDYVVAQFDKAIAKHRGAPAPSAEPAMESMAQAATASVLNRMRGRVE